MNARAEQAWHEALAMMGQFQGPFEVADRNDPNVALRYPSTKAFFEVHSKVAERAAATRRKNRAKPAEPK